MNIEIRKVSSESDIRKTAELADTAWKDHYTSLIGEKQVSYMLEKFQSESAISNQIKYDNYTYYLVYADTDAAGYFGIQPTENYLFLSKLYVLKDFQKRGIASEILAFLKSFNKFPIRLTVNKDNKSSIAVYQHWGFEIVESIAPDIGGGFVMDDYVMELRQ